MRIRTDLCGFVFISINPLKSVLIRVYSSNINISKANFLLILVKEIKK